jgi:predicted amino acid-binding ACT domain protein
LLHHNTQPHYFARNLPIAKPAGKNIFEFLILGRDVIGGYVDVMQVFSKHNVNIKEIMTNEVVDKKLGHCSAAGLFCDFSEADCTVEQVESEIRATKAVIEVHTYDMKDRVWERFFFPTNFNGNRVITLRVEPMLRIERNLIERLGTAGATIMFHEGEIYSEETFAEYKKMLPDASQERLLQCMIDGLRATGWGLVEISKLAAGYEIKIENPPMLNNSDYKENRFLYGAASRLLELIFDVKVFLAESSFDEKTSVLNLKFSVQHLATISLVAASPGL